MRGRKRDGPKQRCGTRSIHMQKGSCFSSSHQLEMNLGKRPLFGRAVQTHTESVDAAGDAKLYTPWETQNAKISSQMKLFASHIHFPFVHPLCVKLLTDGKTFRSYIWLYSTSLWLICYVSRVHFKKFWTRLLTFTCSSVFEKAFTTFSLYVNNSSLRERYHKACVILVHSDDATTL